ncbi:unnamed protein product [Dibothriocephalus latus]|uniref:Uncharacterized protein n=1 Tax=Dibothriocephalus latus TaxID=60516 RepID=A0A3P7MH09_DIBLA|nr:unnamed protein product [Dibothriocephalus latus]
MTPRVEILFDNLAVYMVWKVSEETLLRGAASQQQHQQRQFTNAYDQRTLHQPLNALFRIEYAIQTSQPTVNPALVGLVEPDPPTWTDPQLVDDAPLYVIQHQYPFYLTGILADSYALLRWPQACANHLTALSTH